MISRQDKISYLIDCKCYTEEDAIKYADDLTVEELKDCEKYSN